MTQPTSSPRPGGPRRFDDLGPLGMDVPDPERLPVAILRAAPFTPLIYAKRIDDVDDHAEPGEIVRVLDRDQNPLGYALFNPRSELTLRLLSRGPLAPSADWWSGQFARAIELRREFLKLDEQTSAYRVVHAEGDGLSGLVADRFGDVLSIETFSFGMHRRGRAIAERLSAMLGTSHWMVRPGPKMEGQEGFSVDPITSEGCPAQVEIREFDTRFRVRFEGGHKTGFFCDQRDNRRRVADFAADRTVLDLCCYTGGFAVQAKRLGQAKEVTAVDLDEAPIEIAKQNANLNQVRVQFVHADAFSYMRDMMRGGRRYGVVVLDPPKLIGNRLELEDGKRKHFDLNRLAMQLVEPGGLLLTCCCAGLLGDEDFLRLVLAAARQSAPVGEGTSSDGRRVQILDRTTASADHPVADNCPESAYLKAIWLRIL